MENKCVFCSQEFQSDEEYILHLLQHLSYTKPDLMDFMACIPNWKPIIEHLEEMILCKKRNNNRKVKTFDIDRIATGTKDKKNG